MECLCVSAAHLGSCTQSEALEGTPCTFSVRVEGWQEAVLADASTTLAELVGSSTGDAAASAITVVVDVDMSPGGADSAVSTSPASQDGVWELPELGDGPRSGVGGLERSPRRARQVRRRAPVRIPPILPPDVDDNDVIDTLEALDRDIASFPDMWSLVS